MPIRTNAPGTFDESDLSMLESVLARLDPDSDVSRDQLARRLIHLFQSGTTDPDELFNRARDDRS